MKIIQCFKCFSMDDNSYSNNNNINFEITQYQQTKWIFNNYNKYFIESSLHWNMLLFYIYNHQQENNIEYNLKHYKDNHYILTIDIKDINKEIETILFTFFYYDIHNDYNKIKKIKNNYIFEWNNFYVNLIDKKINTNLISIDNKSSNIIVSPQNKNI